MSKIRLFMILTGFIIPALIVTISHAEIAETGLIELSTHVHVFEVQTNKFRSVHIFVREYIFITCIICCWWIVLTTTLVNSKRATYSGQFGDIDVCTSGMNRVCSNESRKRSFILDILEDDQYPKNSTYFASKGRDIYSHLFLFGQNVLQKCWVLPASLHQYFHELETTSNKSELMKFEWARYETFKTFPMDSPVMPIRLASNGFYFNGSGDSVTCFFCGLQYQGWKDSDIISDIHTQYSPECRFLGGLDRSNIGIHSEDVQGAQGGRDYESNSFSSGEMNIERHSRNTNENESTVKSRRPPKHPEYENYQHRMDTYTEWPYPEVIEPCVLADAGFFFVGFSDCVRCFSCGGGLRNWEYGDGPWEEHARWFPWCTFLKEQKRPALISPHTDREIDTADERTTCLAGKVPGQLTNTASAKTSGECDTEKHALAHSNDNDSKSKTGATHAEKERISSRVERTLFEMGFSEADIQIICEQKGLRGITEINDSTLSQLLDDLLLASEAPSLNTKSAEAVTTVPSMTDQHLEPICQRTNEIETHSVVSSSTETISDPKHLREENLKLKHQLTCKICMDRESDVVFTPCGHMVSCEACALNIRKCAICRQLIKGRVKAFMG